MDHTILLFYCKIIIRVFKKNIIIKKLFHIATVNLQY